MAVEIPPGHAVGGEDDGRVRPQQRRHAIDRGRQCRRLEGDDDRILRPGPARVVRGERADMDAVLARLDGQPAGLDRLEVRTTGDHRHIDAGLRQARGEVAADRAGAIDTDTHGRSLRPDRKNAGQRGGGGKFQTLR